MKRQHFKIVVIGGGPAGLAAATSAAKSTSDIAVIDDNPALGGQIWRRGIYGASDEQARRWIDATSAITILNRAKVIAVAQPDILIVETATEALEIQFERLIIATGARELFLPFPGWTLPGVMGAGGLQALVKAGLPVSGKRVVVAGSGPLLLAVAAYLKGKGARVLTIAEQASWSKLATFALRLARYPGHIGQAGSLGLNLAGVPLRAGCWVSQAHGPERLEAVTLHQGDKAWMIGCDYLACGFGLVPNVELPSALGCVVSNGVVQVDEWQQSSLPHIYCAGEATGIGGLDLSLIEGQIAGFAATGQPDEARACFVIRTHARRFADLLASSFALRDELKTLADADTIVCRCEDVPFHALQSHPNWRSAKLHTRCGMGPCQGRVCGAAASFLFGWTPASVRPPITPTRLTSLAHIETHSDQEQEVEA
jgi:NADPH-dependent 2,4-dienoyl-CoA reductase/sulfur reductase-like enzyme